MKIKSKPGVLYVLLLMAMILQFGCSGGESWKTKDVSGLLPDLAFQLESVSTAGTVTADDFRGKILLVYFGYTQCPDVCSTTMIRLSNALLSLGDLASQVCVLFVSVDPSRDTPRVLRDYTQAFGPQVIGLRGEQDALRKLTKRYRVTYGYGKPDANGNYTVSHSSAIYTFDRSGHARLLIRSKDNLAAIHHDLLKLILKK